VVRPFAAQGEHDSGGPPMLSMTRVIALIRGTAVLFLTQVSVLHLAAADRITG
jgi:hypothetical protein